MPTYMSDGSRFETTPINTRILLVVGGVLLISGYIFLVATSITYIRVVLFCLASLFFVGSFRYWQETKEEYMIGAALAVALLVVIQGLSLVAFNLPGIAYAHNSSSQTQIISAQNISSQGLSFYVAKKTSSGNDSNTYIQSRPAPIVSLSTNFNN
jgi:hypothetical protein